MLRQFIAPMTFTMTMLLAGSAHGAGTPWHLTGDFSEACSCSVPCACNFGENPSPHHFCWALWSLDIQGGSYDNVSLDGLHLAGAEGEKGIVAFLDDRATKEQADALRAIWKSIYDKTIKNAGLKSPKDIPQELRFLGFRTVPIEQNVGEMATRLKIGDYGGFNGKYILGIDGKTPVVVENNWSWNIQHGIKGKTAKLTYKDGFGNRLDFSDTNMNQGKFDWSDTTPVYLR